MYNQSFIDKHLFKNDKSLNAPFRRKESHKVNSENLVKNHLDVYFTSNGRNQYFSSNNNIFTSTKSLNNRLERVQSTISFGNYAKLYDKTK